MNSLLVAPVLTLALASGLAGQQLIGKPVDQKLWTKSERSQWQATSSSADVRAFLKTLHAAYPDAFEISSIGKTLQGRPIQVAIVKRRAKSDRPRLRAVIQANIHGGEIEGKEAVQVLLREIALGGHQDILKDCDIWLVPIFNVDGNDEFHDGNRTSQNGPTGVGKRSNAQDLDLNRDFVKVESPEARAMIGLFTRVDPHLYMDLHTTNGTAHGYHLTYAPSLTSNQDGDLDKLMHDRFIPAVRAAILKNHDVRIFDYGNASRRGNPPSWTTFAHTPRYASNYGGLRNRLSLLSEAYSYLPFKERARATRAFVVESLRELVRRREEVLALCAEADRRVLAGEVRFGYQTGLVEPVEGKILMGSVERQGRRRVANAEYREVEMRIRVRFVAKKSIPYPAAWAVVGASDAVRTALIIHGIQVERLTEAAEVQGEEFVVSSKSRARYVYEGHKVVSLRGELRHGKRMLPVGTLLIRARQVHGRAAAQLLEGHSEDSLASWNFFDADLQGEAPVYPVFRIQEMSALATLKTVAIDAAKENLQVMGAYTPVPGKLPAASVFVQVICLEVGKRSARGGYERGGGWQGRKIEYRVGPHKFQDRAAFVKKVIEEYRVHTNPCVLQPSNEITGHELREIAEALGKAGAAVVYLDRKPE